MTAFVATAETKSDRSFLEVWLITIGHALTHWYPATFYLLLPVIGRELDLSYSEIGLILTFQSLAGAISNLPGGMVVDMVGRKGLLLAVSLFWIGFPYLLMGFSHSYWMLIACVTLVGIGNNLWHPAAIPMLAQRFPERKGLVLSLHGMGGNVGDALAPLAAGALLAVVGWRSVVTLNVVPGAIMATLILLYLGMRQPVEAPQSAPTKRRDYAHDLKLLLRNPVLITLAASSAFRSMTQSALLTFLPLYLAHEMDYSPLWTGVGMFAMQAAGFAASPIAGHLSDRMGRRQIVMSSMAMTCVVLVFMAFAGASSAFVLFIALLGFFLYAIRPVLQAWLLDATPRSLAGTSIGVLFGVQAAGGAIGPIVAGMLADRYGLISTFYFLALTIVVANFFIFFTPVRPAVAAPEPKTA
ncbi:MAG: sugar phosphate permease [Rhodospirillales bacterium]|nr:sugar phosphate permease [Rhodospirillales bacterium]